MRAHRHRASLLDPLDLPELPVPWTGRIAYLDRDGVINIGKETYVNDVSEVEMLKGAGQAIGQLRRAGFRIVICTNQSPIGRGWWDHETLAKIHDYIQEKLLEEDEDACLDLILYSPYSPWSGAHARKGNPGMLEAGRQLIEAAESGLLLDDESFIDAEAYASSDFDETSSVMVGDRSVDMEAADAFGVRGIQVDGALGVASAIDSILMG
ncbi:MAG TPA: HAD-IIIA family hydrolase [Candidatus Thalassarchaeaceae archaeon]|nr:MAG TPA: HAD-IIIA family hydrolase [Candidatus Poseidoniales archaeon]HII48314.1 HAD-IIIA family hydrolase [Candidatus Thalassarchaeaceae archaeon]|tara:strand:- start:4081 stop:4710 length:630 start_codon:yes stop_codon:yes gene_type:complete